MLAGVKTSYAVEWRTASRAPSVFSILAIVGNIPPKFWRTARQQHDKSHSPTQAADWLVICPPAALIGSFPVMMPEESLSLVLWVDWKVWTRRKCDITKLCGATAPSGGRIGQIQWKHLCRCFKSGFDYLEWHHWLQFVGTNWHVFNSDSYIPEPSDN